MSTAGIVIVLMVLFQIALDTFFPTIDIKPVPVPAEMERAGYRPDVVSLKLADEIDRIQAIATTGHRRRTLFFDRPPLDLTMPGLGFSVSSISSYIKAFLSLQETIVCDITIDDNKQYILNIRDRKTQRTQATATVKNSDLDALISEGAKAILRLSDPYVLASYVRTTDPEQAKSLLRDVIQTGDPEELAWAYTMWGVIVKVHEHDIDGGIRYYQMAIDAFQSIPWYRRWFMSKDALASAYVDISIAYHDKDEPATSTRYLMRSVNLGFDNAEMTLAERYLEGFGVGRDPKAAETWLRRAVAQGRPEANYELAQLYLGDVPNTAEVPRNISEGMVRLRYAAMHGWPAAQERFGEEYLSGKNLARDVDQAKYWLSLAAAKGNADAKKQLEMLAKRSGGTAKC
jgi:TPR repeat protein